MSVCSDFGCLPGSKVIGIRAFSASLCISCIDIGETGGWKYRSISGGPGQGPTLEVISSVLDQQLGENGVHLLGPAMIAVDRG